MVKSRGHTRGCPDLRMAFATHPIRPTISSAPHRATPELLRWQSCHTRWRVPIWGGGHSRGEGVLCKGRIRQPTVSIAGSTGWGQLSIPDTTLPQIYIVDRAKLMQGWEPSKWRPSGCVNLFGFALAIGSVFRIFWVFLWAGKSASRQQVESSVHPCTAQSVWLLDFLGALLTGYFAFLVESFWELKCWSNRSRFLWLCAFSGTSFAHVWELFLGAILCKKSLVINFIWVFEVQVILSSLNFNVSLVL